MSMSMSDDILDILDKLRKLVISYRNFYIKRIDYKSQHLNIVRYVLTK